MVAEAEGVESETAKLTAGRGDGFGGVAPTVDLDVLDEEVRCIGFVGNILSYGENVPVSRVNFTQKLILFRNSHEYLGTVQLGPMSVALKSSAWRSERQEAHHAQSSMLLHGKSFSSRSTLDMLHLEVSITL